MNFGTFNASTMRSQMHNASTNEKQLDFRESPLKMARNTYLHTLIKVTSPRLLSLCGKDTVSVTVVGKTLISLDAVHTYPDIFESAIMLSDSKISTLESGFKHIRICLRIRRMRVDDSRIRKEKVADSKISGYVWTGS